jgi:hypothetical protein
VLGRGQPGVLLGHRPGLLGRPLGGQAVLLGLLGRAEGVTYGEHRQQDQREQGDALLDHGQQDRRHGEDHGVGPGLCPEALLEVGDEVAPVGQSGHQPDQDQVADEEDQGGRGERRDVPDAEGTVAAKQLVDATGDGHEQAVLAEVEHQLLWRGPAEQVGDEHGQDQGEGGRGGAPAEQDGEGERLGGRHVLGPTGDLGEDRQRFDHHHADQQHPELRWLLQHRGRSIAEHQ